VHVAMCVWGGGGGHPTTADPVSVRFAVGACNTMHAVVVVLLGRF
jgi:hypothetical protein